MLGERLAEYLQAHDPHKECAWAVFDKGLVEKVLEDHDLSQQIAKFMPKDRYSSIQGTIEELLGLHPQHEALVEKTTETILKLAQMGNAIIIGRGANVILRHVPNAFHVRLVGSVEHRIKRIESYYKMSRSEAAEHVRRTDEGRKRYLKHNFNKNIDDPLLYHMVLNTDQLPTEEAVVLIARPVRDLAHKTPA